MSYTNHTILPEALEEWNRDRLACLLPRQYWMIEQINEKLCSSIRKQYPADDARIRRMSIIENGQIRMAYLAITGAHKVNGVARLHGEILKNRIFKDFSELYPEKFTFITNGVSQRQWIQLCNPLLAAFLNERIGQDWQTDFSTIERLRDYAGDLKSQKAFLEIKLKNKQRLFNFLKSENPIRDLFGNPLTDLLWMSDIDLDSLYDVQIKRIHEYKRQLMNALYLIMLYFDLLEDPESHCIKRTSIFAGKAAAGYLSAKNIIQLLYCMARKINQDPAISRKQRIVFIENYGVSKAEIIIPAAELSEQISMAGLEASGTGNMKLAMNGALTIGTEDGANIEMREAIKNPWWPFSFGAQASALQSLNNYNPWDIYSSHPKIKRALDALKDGTFAKTESEEEALSHLFDTLLMDSNGQKADAFFVLYDLQSYYETQKRVEALYADPEKWAECALHNIAGMGGFSTDASIEKYAQQIWNLHPCPIESRVRREVSQLFTASTLHPH